jgi:DNA-binding NarL/FixJ family response regulator
VATLTGVRVILADDEGTGADLRTALTHEHGIEIVAEARTGDGVLEAALRHRPDVLVVEPGMPNGTAVIRDVRRAAPDVAVLARTDDADDGALRTALRAGARGYIRKDAPPTAVIRAIRCVAAGDAILGPTVTAKLAELLAVQPTRTRTPIPGLTEREHEVLDLIAAGLPNAAIVARLRVAARTLRNHITAIFTKLGVANRAAAIERARAAGMGAAAGLGHAAGLGRATGLGRTENGLRSFA